MIELIVERLILEAMQAGKFDALRGKGSPADLASYFDTPPEVRVVQSMLRDAGFVPLEVELLNEIAELKAAGSGPDGFVIASGRVKRLRQLELELGLLLERHKGTTPKGA